MVSEPPPLEVPIWGPPELTTAEWPRDLLPKPIGSKGAPWPNDRPIVVFFEAAESYRDEAERHLRRDDTLPDAVLLVPPDVDVAPGIASDFDAVVTVGDWDALRAIFRSPHQFAVAALADDVPADWLDDLRQPPETLPLEHLPPAIQAAAAEWWHDSASRSIFNAAVEARLERRRLVARPPRWEAELREWLQRRPVIEPPDLAALAAQSADLRELSPDPLDYLVPEQTYTPWRVASFARVAAEARALRAALDARMQDAGARIHDVGQSTIALLNAAMRRSARLMTAEGLIPLETLGPATESSAEAPPEVPTQQFVLRQSDAALESYEIGWDAARALVVVQNVRQRDHGLVDDYRIELRRGEQVVWSVVSVEGHAEISPDALLKVPEESLASAEQLELVIMLPERDPSPAG